MRNEFCFGHCKKNRNYAVRNQPFLMMILKKIQFFFLLFFTNTLFSSAQNLILGEESVGVASYYGSKFYGRKTASGEILKKGDFTCAHPKLPFGTMLEVTNLTNNKWCVVRVNDRGPFSRSRILDLSHEPAARLAMFKSGTAKVKVMIVGDHGNVIISRPESIIENSMELFKDDNQAEEAVVPFSLSDKSNRTKKQSERKSRKNTKKK